MRWKTKAWWTHNSLDTPTTMALSLLTKMRGWPDTKPTSMNHAFICETHKPFDLWPLSEAGRSMWKWFHRIPVWCVMKRALLRSKSQRNKRQCSWFTQPARTTYTSAHARVHTQACVWPSMCTHRLHLLRTKKEKILFYIEMIIITFA